VTSRGVVEVGPPVRGQRRGVDAGMNWAGATSLVVVRAAAGVCAVAVEVGSSRIAAAAQAKGPARRQEDAMSVFQPDTGSGQPTAGDLPAFRVVRRGYDSTQVDAYIPQLVARLEEAEQARVALQREVASLRQQASPTFERLGAEAAVVLQEAGRSGEQLVEKARRRAEVIVEGAQQQAEQIRSEVTGKAQAVLAEADEAAEQVRQEVEQERAALYAETQQVREFRDGLLEDLGRVHGDISALLERTHRQRDREPPVSDHTATPEVDPAPDLVVEASEPAGAAGSGQPQHVQAPTDARSQQSAALAQAAAARRPGYPSAPARQEARRPGPAG
jgi:cell division septum initiation protein DivIVA